MSEPSPPPGPSNGGDTDARGFGMAIDPDGNYIELFAQVLPHDPRSFEYHAAFPLPFRGTDPAQIIRAVTEALSTGSTDNPLSALNCWVPDYFIPLSFQEWAYNSGSVEFRAHQGREFARPVPLARALLRYRRQNSRGRGVSISDDEIEYHAQNWTLIDLLEALARVRRASDPLTYLSVVPAQAARAGLIPRLRSNRNAPRRPMLAPGYGRGGNESYLGSAAGRQMFPPPYSQYGYGRGAYMSRFGSGRGQRMLPRSYSQYGYGQGGSSSRSRQYGGGFDREDPWGPDYDDEFGL